MTTYLDTSFLIKLYLLEEDSSRADAVIHSLAERAAISWLSSVEMSAALHRKLNAIPHRIDAVRADHAYADFRLDEAAGIYRVLRMDEAVFEMARSLGEKHGLKHKARSLDILHVATAVRDGVRGFATFDERQGGLAAAVGLKVVS